MLNSSVCICVLIRRSSDHITKGYTIARIGQYLGTLGIVGHCISLFATCPRQKAWERS